MGGRGTTDRRAPNARPRICLILVATAAAVLAIPAAGWGHGSTVEPDRALDAVTAAAPAAGAVAVVSCGAAPGLPFTPDQSVTGSFGPADRGSYLMVPFSVPSGADAIRVRYCYDTPMDTSGNNRHTIDLGIYEPESPSDDDSIPGEAEFRGWGGSSRPDTTISGEAVSPESPTRGTTDTTVGYLPGGIPAGTWTAELGVAAIADELPSEDGRVQYRVEVDTIDDPSYSDQPYVPTPYDEAPAATEAGWYAGDMHVHARHSNPNDAEMGATFDYAFCPDPDLGARCSGAESQPGADLDFITLSDYVTTRHWDEIGRFQPDYPGHLIIRSAEVITYSGHTNNHGSAQWADYRTGRIDLAQLAGSGEQTVTGSSSLRGPIAPGETGGVFDQVHDAGGWTQISHPTIFPSSIPSFARACRGCPWDYSPEQTDYAKVDAIEVSTGIANSPFTPPAIQFYEDAIDAGGLNSNHIAAVGSSDSHKAGNTTPTTAPIGQATTVVYANGLSEDSIREGVEAGHTYVKLWGNDGPDLRFTATSAQTGATGIMGDTVTGDGVGFTATVRNLDQARTARPGPYRLLVLRNGEPLSTFALPLQGDEFTANFSSVGPGRYRLQVERGATGPGSIENVSSPIWTTGAAPPSSGDPARPIGPCLNEMAGTNDPDNLRGTGTGDSIRGLGGDDTLRSLADRDCLYGGAGTDRLRAGQGPDTLAGGPGGDDLRAGAGRDALKAGPGADSINALGGARDRVSCGSGLDRATVDFRDRVSGCETVDRRRFPDTPPLSR